MSNVVTEFVLATALATSGTVTVGYPSGYQRGHFIGSIGHKLVAGGNLYSAPNDFELTFNANASSITLTWRAASTLAASTNMKLELQTPGRSLLGPYRWPVQGETSLIKTEVVTIDLGSPNAIVTNGVAQSQSASGAHTLTLNGSLVVGGVAVLDAPRNVIIDSGGADTAVLTINGTDLYGNAMRESLTLNGTTAVSGLKAFKTVTSITSSATITNGAFVGTGDVLGLPVYLPGAGYIVRELENGAAPTAGVTVAGVLTRPTATTGDVRGTYDPNSACDGSRNFKLVVALPDPDNLGVAQFAG